ncbi:MAG: putative lipid II flippase FtsW [bacterium]|nr:putative lipid II flippase FtsW [bacterium]
MKRKPDYIFLIILGILVSLGLVILANTSAVLGQKNFGDTYYYLKHQALYGLAVGAVGFLFFSRVRYQVWRRWGVWLMLGSIFLLFLVFVPKFSLDYGGASRWLKLGPITLQPAEILKLTFILYLASWFDVRKRYLADLKQGLIPFLMVLGLVGALLLAQPATGTFGIIVVIAAAMFFVAGSRVSHLVLASSLAMLLLFALIQISPYRLERFTTFLYPERDPKGSGYQINQAMIAIGSGGLTGVGFGYSLQKHSYLPEPIGDSIFAIFAEETGFLGASFLIILFSLLAFRGFKIAIRAPDFFGQLAAIGISAWIIGQAFMNMAAISGLIPLTGVPLPFISYGGSSLASILCGCGILVNISKQTR